ncbi:MAG: BMP family ABC transporter substrate-binding protein [Desulfurococcales archaeon]|nr:BMP family ABC transporter substrate-binding protein [Desulfurococcales archaeon]
MNKRGISQTAIATVIIIIILIGIGAYYYSSKTGTTQNNQQNPIASTATIGETGTTSPATTTTTQSTSSSTTSKKTKIAVLFDVGGRGDLSFNDMAYMGAENAAKDFGVTVNFLTPKSTTDMEPLLRQLSESGQYNLLVLVGFLWTDALNKTASDFPSQKYALIDSTTGIIRPNEVDILFREQEAASLVGILAAGMAYQLGGNTIGAVAGMDIPPLWKFHIGYLFGAKYYEKITGKNVEVIWQYTGTFGDTQKGYQTAMQMLQQGAKVLYGVAGLTHLGMFDAVIDWNQKGYGKALAIGEDASQEWYNPHYIILSGAKRVDTAVYTAIKMVVDGSWKGGIKVLGLKDNGVGIWGLDGVQYFAQIAYENHKTNLTPTEIVNTVKEMRQKYIPQQAWNIMNQLEEQIKTGKIVFKTPTSEAEYNAIVQELEKGNLNAALEKGTVS